MRENIKPNKEVTLRNLYTLYHELEIIIPKIELDQVVFNECSIPDVHQGYEIGDFVITPRVPKTEFQG